MATLAILRSKVGPPRRRAIPHRVSQTRADDPNLLRGVCLHAWKLFSQALAADNEDRTLGLYRFRHHICHPADELKVFVQPLMSASTHFIAHLVISGGCKFATNELLCLTDLKNLGVLELIQPSDGTCADFPQVSDRLIRSWAETENPFPLLRALRIWGDKNTTHGSLRWAATFPALAVYDVVAAKSDWTDGPAHAAKQGWDMAGHAAGLEDSLSRSLMLCIPGEHSHGIRPVRRVDADLTSLCSDSRVSVKFVTDQHQAPPLLDYLTDPVKACVPTWDIDAAQRQAAGSCHGVAFEAWAFWVYSFLGQLGDDHDLTSYGVRPDAQAVVGPFVLPSKPMASLFLGHSGRGGIKNKPSYVSRGLFSTKAMTFVRHGLINPEKCSAPPKRSQESPNPGWAPREEPSLRTRKRQRLDDILDSLGG